LVLVEGIVLAELGKEELSTITGHISNYLGCRTIAHEAKPTSRTEKKILKLASAS